MCVCELRTRLVLDFNSLCVATCTCLQHVQAYSGFQAELVLKHRGLQALSRS